MIELSYTKGGFPLSNERLETMQKAWQEITAILPALGNQSIVSGCTNTNGVQDEGYIIYNNTLYWVKGGDAYTGYVRTAEDVEYVTYKDGNVNPFATKNYMVPCASTEEGAVSLASLATLRSLVYLDQTKCDSSTLTAKVNTLNSKIAYLENLINKATGEITVDVDTAMTHMVPKGTVIMFGQKIDWSKCTTLAGIKSSGLPYGYVPAGKIKYVTTNSTAMLTAWTAYLNELNVSSSAVTYNSGIWNFAMVAGVDLTDKFVMAAGNSYSLGNTGGSKTTALNYSNIPSHSHDFKNYYMLDSSKNLKPVINGSYNIKKNDNGMSVNWEITERTTAYAYYANDKTDSMGSGSSFSVLNPYYALYYLIKII